MVARLMKVTLRAKITKAKREGNEEGGASWEYCLSTILIGQGKLDEALHICKSSLWTKERVLVLDPDHPDNLM